MSSSSEAYPEDKRFMWIFDYGGTMAAHTTFIRLLTNPNRSAPPHDPTYYSEAVTKLYFLNGSWEGGVWISGATESCGVLLGFREDGENSTVLLGDYREYQRAEEGYYRDSREILRADTLEVRLSEMNRMSAETARPSRNDND